ncbi:MAG: hypothetical protein IKZ96_02250 [Bacilli bacterium]|nr:hypothetical protein [Bacilli bacterium]
MNPLSKLILHKVEIEKEKAVRSYRFSLFCTGFANEIFSTTTKYKDLKFFYDMIKANDKLCDLCYPEGEYIDQIANTSDAFIHRTHLGINPNESGIPKNENLINIMTTGLRNYGHLNASGGSAITTYLPPLSRTMTPLKGITGYINLLSPYKDNDAVIIAAFPKFLVDEDGRPTTSYDDIYNMEEDAPSIKPDYIKGAMVRKGDGNWHYYSKSELLENYKRRNI